MRGVNNMKIDAKILGSVLAPRLVSKALRLFDRATMFVVAACWCAALLMMAFALYTVSLSVTAKRAALAAAATEPSLPKVVNKLPDASEIQPLMERLQKRFPDISFSLARGQLLTISANDSSRFRSWLTVLSYVDTISPQYRWSVKELCVGGKCQDASPMRAVLEAEKISFATPQAKK